MPDFSTLVLFAAACLALTATPGPDMLLIVSRSVSQGRASGFATLAGIQVGTYCHALAAALGLSQLFLVVPLAYDVVRYVGAAYLLYLAWQAFRSAVRAAGRGLRRRADHAAGDGAQPGGIAGQRCRHPDGQSPRPGVFRSKPLAARAPAPARDGICGTCRQACAGRPALKRPAGTVHAS
jgi:LysE type translocator